MRKSRILAMISRHQNRRTAPIFVIRHGQVTPSVSGQMLTFEVIRRGSPDFVGLRDIFSGPLSGGPVIAMLCFVVHRLGDSRKSAREVGASRLFCFNAGFSGSPNRLSFRRAISGSIPVHKSTDKGVYLCHMLGPTASAGPAALAATSTDRLVPSIESPPDK